ncbi:GNAT family N-acetyltransferase [Aeoliella sp. ICT_H6.2]|uniref:GNAT family N-acetyltransferase n=1 Tax=Aeoliella straminimaris TaxID=2954799 RepID=A0A9X2F9U9_9BACT|nr:GNAT family N-acetyltransferase [Aeoliella straminimaris]MCO6044955.1 GNAT family N-acetyltransferase [Aeoliella straminimaris]
MSAASSPAVGTATIRPLSPDDLPQVAAILSQRDEHPWSLESTRWFVQGLDQDKCRAWGAVDGDKLVGLTSFFLRTLYWQGEPHRVAYWANLYIDPAYRAQMLYPRLPMTMLRGIKDAGAEFLYAAVRLQDVARAHSGMGFGEIGPRNVWVRFLRPGHFAAKYKKLPAVTGVLTVPLDACYSLGVSLRGRLAKSHAVEDLAIDEAPLAEMAEMANEAAAGQFAQVWTAEMLAERYAQTREGGAYRILVCRDAADASLESALVYRLAERGAGIQVAVIMDLMHAPGNTDAMVAAVHRLEALAMKAGSEAILYFDALGDAMRDTMRSCGFRQSPEKYTFMVYPKKVRDEHPWLTDMANWNYSFRDHDAF